MGKSVAVKSSPLTWLCRALWLSLPLLLGDVFTARLSDASTTTTVVWQVFLWSVWLAAGIASLVQVPTALTIVRMMVPMAPVLGAVWWLTSDTDQRAGLLGVAGLLVALVLVPLVMSADVGSDFIDGASYGDERRVGLNPPVFVLVGPVQLLWLLATVPVLVAVTLFASERWVAGLLVAVVAVLADWYSFRLLNRLSQRCLVLVPAGMTLVDPLSLAEPTLFRRDDIVRLGPAVVGADEGESVADLTVGAPGLVVSVDFTRKLSIVPTPARGRVADPVEVASVLLVPSRPGRLLTMAEGRRIAVGRD